MSLYAFIRRFMSDEEVEKAQAIDGESWELDTIVNTYFYWISIGLLKR